MASNKFFNFNFLLFFLLCGTNQLHCSQVFILTIILKPNRSNSRLIERLNLCGTFQVCSIMDKKNFDTLDHQTFENKN